MPIIPRIACDPVRAQPRPQGGRETAAININAPWRFLRAIRFATEPPTGQGANLAVSVLASVDVQRSCDHFFHDLIGAAVDLLHTGVGVEFADRVFGHVAVAAVQLQAFVHDLA